VHATVRHRVSTVERAGCAQGSQPQRPDRLTAQQPGDPGKAAGI
jgi:hypothetical protein